MIHLSAADWIVIGEFLLALFGLAYFVIRFAISTGGDWARNPGGRHLMFFRGSLSAFMTMGVVNNFWLDYPGRDAVRVIVIGTFALATVHGDLLLEREQRARRRLLAARSDAERVDQR